MALTFFDPSTAPMPARPEFRDQSALTQANRTRPSPAGPIAATLTSCVPRRSLTIPSASRQVFPASSGAGRIWTSSSSRNRIDNWGARPSSVSMSTPVWRSSMPKVPPTEESPYTPVCGEIDTSEVLPEDGQYVPVSGPGAMASRFSGPRGSIWKSCFTRWSHTTFAPNPRPPTKRSMISSLIGRRWARPSVRSTWRRFLK